MFESRKYLFTACIGLATLAGVTACHTSSHAQVQNASGTGASLDPNADPTDQNMAPIDSSGQPLTSAPADAQQPVYQPSTGGAPVVRQAPTAPSPDQYAAQQAAQPGDQNFDEQNYNQQLVDSGQAALEAPDAPPELPVYSQPPAPDPDYLWTPGYWNYAPYGGYYWVPGAWVAAPYVGALWTPGYWFFFGGRYRFCGGYWGPHIGFYGGINYGFGYFGSGYRGGYWNGNHFYYNRSVNNVNVHITNVYTRNVVVENRGNRMAFNGPRGIQARPRPTEVAAFRGPRIPPMTAQRDNVRVAQQNKEQFYNQNKGRPAMVAEPRAFSADRNVPRPAANQLPERVTRPNQPGNEGRPGQPGQTREAQPSQPNRPGGDMNRPGNNNGNNVRPTPGNGQTRPETQPGVRPTPGQPQVRPTPEQPQVRPTPQQPQVRPAPQQPNPQPRSNNNYQPRATPQPDVRPQPQQQVRPQPQPQPQARPEQQPRPQPQAQPHPQPQAQPRPQPQQQQQPRPQPQQQPRPQPQAQPHPQPQGHPAPPPKQNEHAHR